MVDNELIARWFPVGLPIPESLQVGRANIIDRLEQRLRGADKVKLSRGRRQGKSSAGQRRRRPPTGWLADRLGELLGREERVAADMLTGLLATTGSPAAILARAAEASEGQPIGVLIDEAHHIASWPAGEQAALRDFLRSDRRVGVIVASSRRLAMRELYQDGGPFQYAGEYVELGDIPLDDWRRELPLRFDTSTLRSQPTRWSDCSTKPKVIPAARCCSRGRALAWVRATRSRRRPWTWSCPR